MNEKTGAKFSEAQFFLRQLEAELGQLNRDRAPFCYYLSAFLAASRSASLFAREEDPPRYEAIYAAWLDDLDSVDGTLWARMNTVGMPFFDAMALWQSTSSRTLLSDVLPQDWASENWSSGLPGSPLTVGGRAMNKSGFSEGPMATAVRHVDAGAPVAEVTRTLGIREQTSSLWRNT